MKPMEISNVNIITDTEFSKNSIEILAMFCRQNQVDLKQSTFFDHIIIFVDEDETYFYCLMTCFYKKLIGIINSLQGIE